MFYKKCVKSSFGLKSKWPYVTFIYTSMNLESIAIYFPVACVAAACVLLLEHNAD